ncbi:MAG TPA: hypothetical protein VGP82_12770 [Ktedonobacterales bacterium]|jgi:hypothetical protein|nr:hypothetical protein [Ktedonobacterales bacterium]
MSVRATVRSFALPLGILSGLFAMVQVFVSVSAARAGGPALRSLHQIFGGVSLVQILDGTAPGIISNPLPLFGDLAGVMFITYTAAFVTGCICLGFCWYAGRQTAFVLGHHTAGGRVGFQVMLISSAIWIAASIGATLVAGADGTITGIFTSAFAGGDVTTEVIALLMQEAVAVVFGFGVGALAGKLGEWSARTAPRQTIAPPAYMMMPYPPYPGVQPATPNWQTYPPPPSYYHPGPQNLASEHGAPSTPEGTNGL